LISGGTPNTKIIYKNFEGRDPENNSNWFADAREEIPALAQAAIAQSVSPLNAVNHLKSLGGKNNQQLE